MRAANNQQPALRASGRLVTLHISPSCLCIGNQTYRKKPGRNLDRLIDLNKVSRRPGIAARPQLLMLSIDVVHVMETERILSRFSGYTKKMLAVGTWHRQQSNDRNYEGVSLRPLRFLACPLQDPFVPVSGTRIRGRSLAPDKTRSRSPWAVMDLVRRM